MTKDIYGVIDSSKWDGSGNFDWNKIPQRMYFIKNVIHPELEKEGYSDYLNETGIYNYIIKEIENIIKKVDNSSPVFDLGNMTGIEYEKYCRRILEEAGWDVEETSTTGDQGVDLIACIENIRVCIQCKCFAKPVGNKAVQEIVAGKTHWNGTHSVVVAKSGFTKSAQQLAESTNVILISELELQYLEDRVL